MICPTCHGTGRGPNDGTYLYASINLRVDIRGTCPECRGSGISSCCDTAGAGIAATLGADMTDWPAEGARMEAEVCGDIVGPDFSDPPRNSPQMLRWAFAASAVLWAVIWFIVWELTRL